MKTLTKLAAAVSLLAAPALAEGELNFFNFGLYTPPELLEKFEAETGIKVNLSEFDSMETAIARVQAGGHGLDAMVVSEYYIDVFVSQDLLLESRPDQMPNFANMNPVHIPVTGDLERHYTVPWVWGSTGVMVNTALYDGPIDTVGVILDPPEALHGTINVVPMMNDVIDLTLRYLGYDQCTDDLDALKAARDKLLEAKPHWASIDYASFEKFVNEDLNASVFWNGAASRIRADNDGFAYALPKEGWVTWIDNVAVLKDAQNPEAAKRFLDFLMAPENAALVSNYTRYGNGILGSEDFMDPTLVDAPEMQIPDAVAEAGFEQKICPPDVQSVYTRIWTDVTK